MTDHLEQEKFSQLTDIVGALSAMKGQTLILMIGEAVLPLHARITSNMSLYSRLVINLPNESSLSSDTSYSDSDLRVAIHVQEATSFLDDIQRHTFSLVVIGDLEFTPEIADRIPKMLDTGGTLVVVSPKKRRQLNPLSEMAQCFRVELPSCVLYVKSDDSRNPKRKGGRRGRSR